MCRYKGGGQCVWERGQMHTQYTYAYAYTYLPSGMWTLHWVLSCLRPLLFAPLYVEVERLVGVRDTEREKERRTHTTCIHINTCIYTYLCLCLPVAALQYKTHVSTCVSKGVSSGVSECTRERKKERERETHTQRETVYAYILTKMTASKHGTVQTVRSRLF